MCRANLQEQGGASRSLLDVLAAGKEDEAASDSLMAALGGKSTVHSSAADNQFKLPDLVSSEVKEQMAGTGTVEAPAEIREQTSQILPYTLSKEQIKLGAALQREQQKKKAE